MQLPAGNKPATSLLGAYRNVDICGIFQLDSAELKDEAIIIASGELKAFLEGVGIDPSATRYQVEFMTPANPLNTGFYQLLGVKVLPAAAKDKGHSEAVSGIGETTVIDFIGQFMANQEKELEIERGCGIIYPIAKKDGILVIASSQTGILAITAS